MNENPNTVPRKLKLNANGDGVDVLFQDEHLLAVDKPAGLLSVRDRWDAKKDNLVDLLKARIPGYLANVHRLDRDTSGVFLLARSRAALSGATRQFHLRETEKNYQAIVRGVPREAEMTIDLNIGDSLRQSGLAVIQKSGKPAQTKIRVLERFRGFTLLWAQPLTGRMHQIRIHLKSIGCPVLADEDYGDGEPLCLSNLKRDYKTGRSGEKPLLARQALHAELLALRHPATGERLEIRAPMPDDMQLALKYLRKYALA